jgi:hypothetical protein
MNLVLSPKEKRIAARGLFKLDRPRAIDRLIDYFGGRAGHAAQLTDACGEYLLDGFEAYESRVLGRFREAVASGGA